MGCLLCKMTLKTVCILEVMKHLQTKTYNKILNGFNNKINNKTA